MIFFDIIKQERRMIMPGQFLEKMKILLSNQDYEKLIQSYQEQPRKSIRLQLQKMSPKKWELVCPFDISSIPIVDGGYYIHEEKIGNHPYHHAGLFYVQEPSAMLPPLLVPFQKDFKILDLCASPGGKTLALSNQVPNGFVLANEVNYNRAKKLLSNVERLGLKNVVVSSMSVDSLENIYQEYFDVILIDAPCSGEGMFRKDGALKKDWSIEKVDQLSIVQKELLEKSAGMLKENGYLIYSTCTFEVKENEQQIVEFLKGHEFEIVPIKKEFEEYTKPGVVVDPNYSTNQARRCYPFLYGEGQFMVVLQKNYQHNYKKVEDHLQDLSVLERKIVNAFIEENCIHFDYVLKKYQNNIVILPHDVIVPRMTLLSCFVKMGEIVNSRFVPHHQFVKAYGNHFKNQCHLSLFDDRLCHYLKGEEVEAFVDDGYGVIMVDGYPLGLYKAKNHRLKNHYPKGLRYQ